MVVDLYLLALDNIYSVRSGGGPIGSSIGVGGLGGAMGKLLFHEAVLDGGVAAEIHVAMKDYHVL